MFLSKVMSALKNFILLEPKQSVQSTPLTNKQKENTFDKSNTDEIDHNRFLLTQQINQIIKIPKTNPKSGYLGDTTEGEGSRIGVQKAAGIPESEDGVGERVQRANIGGGGGGGEGWGSPQEE